MVSAGVVQAQLRLRDTLSASMRSAAATTKSASRSIGSDTDRAARQAESGFARIKRGALGLQGVLLGAGFGAAAKKLIALGTDAEETANLVTLSFGRQEAAVREWARTYSQTVSSTAFEASKQAASINILIKSMGLAGDASARMSQQLTQVANDISSAYNIDRVQDVIENLRSGLVGETEPLRKFGVLLSEARVKTEAYASGLAAAGAELTEQQKVQARVNLILRDTALVQGDAANTANSAANQIKALKSEALDLGRSIGVGLLPVVTDLVGMLRGAIEGVQGLGGAFSGLGNFANLVRQGYSISDAWRARHEDWAGERGRQWGVSMGSAGSGRTAAAAAAAGGVPPPLSGLSGAATGTGAGGAAAARARARRGTAAKIARNRVHAHRTSTLRAAGHSGRPMPLSSTPIGLSGSLVGGWMPRARGWGEESARAARTGWETVFRDGWLSDLIMHSGAIGGWRGLGSQLGSMIASGIQGPVGGLLGGLLQGASFGSFGGGGGGGGAAAEAPKKKRGFWGRLWGGIKKVGKIAAPIAASFIPGVGPVLGAALSGAVGAGMGALDGGGWRGALMGGVGGAAGGWGARQAWTAAGGWQGIKAGGWRGALGMGGGGEGGLMAAGQPAAGGGGWGSRIMGALGGWQGVGKLAGTALGALMRPAARGSALDQLTRRDSVQTDLLTRYLYALGGGTGTGQPGGGAGILGSYRRPAAAPTNNTPYIAPGDAGRHAPGTVGTDGEMTIIVVGSPDEMPERLAGRLERAGVGVGF